MLFLNICWPYLPTLLTIDLHFIQALPDGNHNQVSRRRHASKVASRREKEFGIWPTPVVHSRLHGFHLMVTGKDFDTRPTDQLNKYNEAIGMTDIQMMKVVDNFMDQHPATFGGSDKRSGLLGDTRHVQKARTSVPLRGVRGPVQSRLPTSNFFAFYAKARRAAFCTTHRRTRF